MNGSQISRKKDTSPQADDRLFGWAVGLWIALAVAICIKAIVQGGNHSVYPVYAWGSHHWWADQSLYPVYADLNIDIFRYSPTFAIFFTPFALLPDWLGASLWGILSIATIFYALRVLVKEILPGSWPERREAWFLGLSALGSMSGLWSGQSNSLLLALVIFAAVAIKRHNWWTASLLLALPVFIKIWPIAVAFLFIACWPKQLSWRFALCAIALALLPFLTRPFHTVIWQYHEWYVSLIDQDKGRWEGFRDAWTIWENLWPPVSQRGYQVLQLVSSLPVLIWCLWQKKRGRESLLLSQHECSVSETVQTAKKTPDPFISIISIWASWQLFFGPGSEQLTYGLIAPSAAWAVLVSFDEKKHRLWTTITWLCLVLFSCGEIEGPLKNIHPAFTMLLPLSVASFAAWLVYHETSPKPLSQ